MSGTLTMGSTLFAVGMAVGLFAMSPGAAALHGSPYVARGTATGGDLQFDATLTWPGSFLPGAGGLFKFQLKDPATGLELPAILFPGREHFTNVHFEAEPACAFIEVFDYRAVAAVGPAELPDAFEVVGGMRADFCTGLKTGFLAGHFGTFVLDLHVP